MAFFDTHWYVNFGDGSTTGHYAVAKRPQNTAVVVGQIVRQFTTPAVGSERCFVCVTAGTTANTTDAWFVSRAAATTDGTATWRECTGMSAMNGDFANTPNWNTPGFVGTSISPGVIVRRLSGVSYQMFLSSGAAGASEPAFSDTPGTIVSNWVCLGPVGNFTAGGAPHARLANVFGTSWFASGNTVYVGDNHAETATTAVGTFSPSSALMAKILCHNHSGSYPPAASDITTGASITTSASNQINFTGQGSFYFYGIIFQTATIGPVIGASAVGQTQNWYYFDNCSWRTSGAGFIQIGATSTAWGVVIFNNTTVKFGNVAASITPYFAQFVWQNTGDILASGSTVPTALFVGNSASGRFSNVTLNNLDLSQITGLLNPNSQPTIGTLIVQDCKLNAAMTVTTPINTGMIVQMIRSDSAGTSYKSTRYTYEGTETTETSIVRTDGAVDPAGQAQSRKIVTSANAQWLRPFCAEPYAIWNATTGADVDVTVYGTVNAGSLPNSDDLFMEVEYLSDSGSPLGEIVTTTKASVLASNAAVSSDSSTWGGGGSGAGWSPFKLVATLSSPQPQLAGYLHARVRVAKVSTTYYLDPKVVLS